MTEEQNKANTWDLSISLEQIEEKFNEIAAQVPDITIKIFFCPKSREVTMKAHNSYAKYGQDETPIIVHDDTVFGKCNLGFLLTDKNIYSRNRFSGITIIPTKEIKNISSSVNRGVPIFIVNVTIITLTQIANAELQNALRDLLQYIVFEKGTVGESSEKDVR